MIVADSKKLTHEDISAFLRKDPLFRTLTNEERDHLLMPSIAVFQFKKGQIIMDQEEKSEYVFLVVKGIVKKKRNNKEGKEFIIEFGGKSFLSGLGEAVSGFPIEGATMAVTPVTALRIPSPDIQFLLRNNQFFSNEVNHFLARKTIYLYEFMSELVFSPARNRLASNLIRLAEVLRENGNKGFIPLGQFDLAAHTGTTRETVSRVLNDLEDEGLLQTRSNQVQILQLEKLKEVAYLYT